MPKKLDTFILKDRFELDQKALIREAEASAVRRSEIMGWLKISVRPAKNPVSIDGDYRCYSFEIWGTERTGTPASRTQSKGKISSKDIRI